MNATENHSVLTLANLPSGKTIPVLLVPEKQTLKKLAEALGLLDLRKVRFEGNLVPDGSRDWRLEAKLGASLVQPCSISLVPVTTRIDVRVVRRYAADFSYSEDSESEMPEDESLEPLPASIELLMVVEEELAIAAPDFPRAKDVELGEAVFAAPDVKPLRDDDIKPFAGLADLKKN